jgi:23S rRNA (uracil1939-C5)-methyltransferase
MASVLGPEGFQEQLAEALAGAGLGTVAFQDGSYRGRGYVSLNLGGMPFTVGPWSFMQSNWALNVALVELLVESLREALSGAVVLDAYAGGGNFTLPLARLARQVVAVEENPHAVEDGRRNARLGGLDNIRWIQAPVERAPLKGREFQVAVLDPPRAGLTKEALRRLTELHPQWIAYVSCNPTTLARDLRGLLGGYELCGLRMVDMFPQTYHIEALVLLRAKGAG